MNTSFAYPALIDLHLHMDGSVPVKTARMLAAMQGIALPASDEELRSKMSLTPDCHDLNDYLERFDIACSLLHTRDGLRVCARELLNDLYEQGLMYAEIRFAPQSSCEQGLTQLEAAQAVIEAFRDAPIPCGLILSMMRGDDRHERNMETVEVAKQLHGKGVVAVDLAGAEALYPTRLFNKEFAAVREAGVPLIIHAGEAAGAESVREAIEAGAVRIGHGVRALEDPSVVMLLAEKRIMLELCPTSNIDTGIFSSYEEYPLRRLMEAGVRVCINTDDMTVSSTTLKDEWNHVIETFHLNDLEVQHILRDTIEASFAPPAVKQSLLCQLSNI